MFYLQILLFCTIIIPPLLFTAILFNKFLIQPMWTSVKTNHKKLNELSLEYLTPELIKDVYSLSKGIWGFLSWVDNYFSLGLLMSKEQYKTVKIIKNTLEPLKKEGLLNQRNLTQLSKCISGNWKYFPSVFNEFNKLQLLTQENFNKIVVIEGYITFTEMTVTDLYDHIFNRLKKLEIDGILTLKTKSTFVQDLWINKDIIEALSALKVITLLKKYHLINKNNVEVYLKNLKDVKALDDLELYIEDLQKLELIKPDNAFLFFETAFKHKDTESFFYSFDNLVHDCINEETGSNLNKDEIKAYWTSILTHKESTLLIESLPLLHKLKPLNSKDIGRLINHPHLSYLYTILKTLNDSNNVKKEDFQKHWDTISQSNQVFEISNYLLTLNTTKESNESNELNLSEEHLNNFWASFIPASKLTHLSASDTPSINANSLVNASASFPSNTLDASEVKSDKTFLNIPKPTSYEFFQPKTSQLPHNLSDKSFDEQLPKPSELKESLEDTISSVQLHTG